MSRPARGSSRRGAREETARGPNLSDERARVARAKTAACGALEQEGSRGEQRAGCRPGEGRSDGTLPLPLPAWLLLGNGQWALGTGQSPVGSGQWAGDASECGQVQVGECKWVSASGE